MENLNIEFIVLAICGFLVSVLYPIYKKSKTEKLSWKKFFSDNFNLVRILFGIIAATAILLMSDSLTQILGISVDPDGFGMDVVAFGAGHSPHFILRHVLKFFKPKEKEEKDNGLHSK